MNPQSARSSSLGGHDKNVSAGCDECEWSGDSRRACAAHHRATGHACHVVIRETFYYGDPLKVWAREQGLTLGPKDQGR